MVPRSLIALGSRGRRTRQVPIRLFTMLFFMLASCTHQALAVAQTNAHDRAEGVERELTIYVDGSKSLNDSALTEAVRTLRTSLPHIIEKWNVTKLRGYCFAQDGWAAEEKLSRDLPRLMLPRPQLVVTTEVTGIFRNIAVAKQQQEDDRLAEEEATARRHYRQEVEQALSTIDHAALLPPADFPSRCTDLNGMLHRVAETVGPRPRLAALITDGAESCSPALQPVPPPQSDLSLVVMLVPEKPRGVFLPTSGKRKKAQPPVSRPIAPAERGDQQFAIRKEQLASAIPWALVVPYFHEDLSNAFAAAEQMRTPRTTKE